MMVNSVVKFIVPDGAWSFPLLVLIFSAMIALHFCHVHTFWGGRHLEKRVFSPQFAYILDWKIRAIILALEHEPEAD